MISAAAATLLALSFGFRIVIFLGALCYGLCAVMARPGLTIAPTGEEVFTPRPG